jgi:hypothetical protein
VLDGNGTPLQRSHGPFAIKEIKIKQGLAIDPIYIAILITLAAGPAKKETWCARIKIPPGMLSLFQLIGRPNIITTGYSFCSRARIISETENQYTSIEHHNPRIPKRSAPFKANSNEACAIHGRHSIRLLAEV